MNNNTQRSGETSVKRGRGRPRKERAFNEELKVKRGRGRPRKYPVLEKERTQTGEIKALIKKVDSGYLLEKLLHYFTSLLVLHGELGKEAGKMEVVFQRLKRLDFQMVEVCKHILASEYTSQNEKAE